MPKATKQVHQVKLTVHLPDGIRHRNEISAAAQGMGVNAYCLAAILDHLDQDEQPLRHQTGNMAAEVNNQQAGRQGRLDRKTARVWRTRWLAASPRLAAAEARGCSDKEFSALVEAVLADESTDPTLVPALPVRTLSASASP